MFDTEEGRRDDDAEDSDGGLPVVRRRCRQTCGSEQDRLLEGRGRRAGPQPRVTAGEPEFSDSDLEHLTSPALHDVAGAGDEVP